MLPVGPTPNNHNASHCELIYGLFPVDHVTILHGFTRPPLGLPVYLVGGRKYHYIGFIVVFLFC